MNTCIAYENDNIQIGGHVVFNQISTNRGARCAHIQIKNKQSANEEHVVLNQINLRCWGFMCLGIQ